jgi:tryptophanyl-tRNA synthetase
MDENSVITKKVKSAVTDTEAVVRFDRETKPGVSNLLGIFSLITGETIPALEARFEGQGYGALKGELADALVAHIEPIRDRANELLTDPAQLDALLAEGASRANDMAEATLAKVYERIGFVQG